MRIQQLNRIKVFCNPAALQQGTEAAWQNSVGWGLGANAQDATLSDLISQSLQEHFGGKKSFLFSGMNGEW
jgi:hypothetical protein